MCNVLRPKSTFGYLVSKDCLIFFFPSPQFYGSHCTLGTLHAQEGLRGLTSGILPTLLRDVPFSGLYLMFYTQLKSRLKSADLENPGNQIRKIYESSELRNFGCGLWAGALACLVTHPVDVIKTKIQVSTPVLKSGL